MASEPDRGASEPREIDKLVSLFERLPL
jgi:hypothetical protein